MGAEEKRKKIKIIPGTHPKARAEWPKRLSLVQATPWADFALSLFNCDQLWQLFSRGWTILYSTIIHNLDSRITTKYSKCQTSFYSMQVSFCFHSLRCSEILVSPSICKDSNLEFHRTEKVSNNFSVNWHITHISMAISANLGRDTNHNSTKLVCSHPLSPLTIHWNVYVNRKSVAPTRSQMTCSRFDSLLREMCRPCMLVPDIVIIFLCVTSVMSNIYWNNTT